jgi:glycerophosphoryl diester phosphodiesterase
MVNEAANLAQGGTSRPVIGRAIRTVWRRLPDLLFFDVAYRAITATLLAPIAALCLDKAVAATGESAIGNLEIAAYLTTPWGVAIAFVSATVLIAAQTIEVAGLVCIGGAATAGRRISWTDALRFVLSRGWILGKACAFTVAVLLIIWAPLLWLAIQIGDRLLGRHDINYYLEARPPEFVWSVVSGAAVAALGVGLSAIVLLAAALALPRVLFFGVRFRESWKHSLPLIRERWRTLLMIMFCWWATSSVVTSLVGGISIVVARALVHGLSDNHLGLAYTLGAVTAVQLLCSGGIAFLWTAFGTQCVVEMSSSDASFWPEVNEVLADQPELDSQPAWALSRRSAIAIGAYALVVSAGSAALLAEAGTTADGSVCIAHRGSSLAAPENTLAAVEQAIRDAADYVEVDVQLTADQQIVVAHDADLMRVARSPLVVSESTLAELQAVDVGRGFPSRFAAETPPTLEDVIGVVRGRAKLIVELKSYGEASPKLAADVATTLRDFNMLNDAMIMSLKQAEVIAAKEAEPRVSCGFVASKAVGGRRRQRHRLGYRRRARAGQAGLRLDGGF